MVLADFLTETRKRWLKAFKLFKGTKLRKNKSNRISPVLHRSPSYSGTVDASADIDLQRFCACRSSMPPLRTSDHPKTPDSSYENASFCSNYFNNNSVTSECGTHSSEYGTHSSDSGTRSSDSVTNGSDSAFGSARSSPSQQRLPICYATVTYYNVDSDDSSSIRTELTLLDYDGDIDESDEITQNAINESLEIVSSL